LLLVANLAALVIGLLAVLAFGHVNGLEFSPQSFERRSYTFFQIPLVRWQVTPTSRSDETLMFEQYLRQQRLLPHRRGPRRWDIVWVVEASRQRDGNPAILTRYLDLEGTQPKQHWHQWTIDHPEQAKALWPAVQLAAVLNAYELIPPLFDFAATDAPAEDFAQQLWQRLSRSLTELADDRAAAEQWEAARRIYTAVLEQPNLDAELRRHVVDRLERRPRQMDRN
jgi:hypothetical protein